MVADVIINKNLNSIETKLFIRGRKLNISPITQSYHKMLKDGRLNCPHFLLQKFQTNERYNKLNLIIHLIFALETL